MLYLGTDADAKQSQTDCDNQVHTKSFPSTPLLLYPLLPHHPGAVTSSAGDVVAARWESIVPADRRLIAA